MPKLKTRKSVSKRFKVTASGKVTRRQSKQNHFNARQTSKKKRSKRRDHVVAPGPAYKIVVELPYV